MKITDLNRAWFAHWRQASFRGVPFWVEVGSKASGRRTVVHQFPKRNVPYAEDMGKEAYAFAVTGYLIEQMSILFGYGDYVNHRDALEAALESSQGPGTLVLPTRADVTATCMRYSIMERRTDGGFCQLDMAFVEAGQPNNPLLAQINPAAQVSQNATALVNAAAASFNVTVGAPPLSASLSLTLAPTAVAARIGS